MKSRNKKERLPIGVLFIIKKTVSAMSKEFERKHWGYFLFKIRKTCLQISRSQ
jgi:hypothetical protein